MAHYIQKVNIVYYNMSFSFVISSYSVFVLSTALRGPREPKPWVVIGITGTWPAGPNSGFNKGYWGLRDTQKFLPETFCGGKVDFATNE